MGLMRYSTGAALAAVLLAGSAHGQTVPSSSPAQPPAAGALNPAAEEAPARQAAEPQFEMADGIVATVNDRIITGYDLRQRMLMLIASSQVQPTQENLPAIQQAALNAGEAVDEGELAAALDNFEHPGFDEAGAIGHARLPDHEVLDDQHETGAGPRLRTGNREIHRKSHRREQVRRRRGQDFVQGAKGIAGGEQGRERLPLRTRTDVRSGSGTVAIRGAPGDLAA